MAKKPSASNTDKTSQQGRVRARTAATLAAGSAALVAGGFLLRRDSAPPLPPAARTEQPAYRQNDNDFATQLELPRSASVPRTTLDAEPEVDEQAPPLPTAFTPPYPVDRELPRELKRSSNLPHLQAAWENGTFVIYVPAGEDLTILANHWGEDWQLNYNPQYHSISNYEKNNHDAYPETIVQGGKPLKGPVVVRFIDNPEDPFATMALSGKQFTYLDSNPDRTMQGYIAMHALDMLTRCVNDYPDIKDNCSYEELKASTVEWIGQSLATLNTILRSYSANITTDTLAEKSSADFTEIVDSIVNNNIDRYLLADRTMRKVAREVERIMQTPLPDTIADSTEVNFNAITEHPQNYPDAVRAAQAFSAMADAAIHFSRQITSKPRGHGR